MSDVSTENTPKPRSSALSKLIRLAAVPFAAVSGFWFGQTSIRNSAYDNARNIGAMTGIREPHHEQLKEIGRQANEALAQGKTFDLNEIAGPLHATHTKGVTERLEKLGLGTLRKQWKYTSKYQKQQAIMSAFTAAGIAMGALFALSTSKVLNKDMGDDAQCPSGNQR